MDHTLNAVTKLDESGPEAPRSLPTETIRGELQRILASRTFRAAKGQKKFLAYTVQEVLSGRAHLLKEYVIATEALDREASFDPRLDPIVRTEARKLRARLAKYYQTEGFSDPLRVELPKGSYVPYFHAAVTPAPELPSQAKETKTPPITSAAEGLSIPTAQPAAVIDRRQPHRKGVLVSFAVLVLAASSAAFYLSHSRLPATFFAANEPSIAVLPLVNLSDSNQEFLSDGLTDELINTLKQVPGLQVVARTSAFRFKAKTFDLREIDQKLHVRAVLVGTVRESENQLKVAVQLNNAETGYHLWSGSYERDSENIGTIPPEIASAVTNVLGVGLVHAGGQNLIQQQASPNSGAHENYLRGLYFRNRFTVDSLNRAIEYFKQAIAEDPSFAMAYAGLADCYAMARPVAATPPLEVVSKIKATASKAIELDGTLGEPHIDLAVSAEYEFDWATAEREFKKGLQLSPDDVVGHLWYAWYLALVGRKDEVLTQRTIAARLDPVSPSAVESLGDYYSAVGRFDAAVEQFRSALALEPNFGPALADLGETYLAQGRCENAIEELRLANEWMPGPRRLADLGYGYAVCGHTAEARRILRAFLKEPQRRPVPAFAIAQLYIGLGDKDRAFQWLEKAIDERDLGMGLNWDVWFHSLRSDPRFGGLLHRMKLT
jgi:TolB-like protein/Flp pilus assembly protein TadD